MTTWHTVLLFLSSFFWSRGRASPANRGAILRMNRGSFRFVTLRICCRCTSVSFLSWVCMPPFLLSLCFNSTTKRAPLASAFPFLSCVQVPPPRRVWLLTFSACACSLVVRRRLRWSRWRCSAGGGRDRLRLAAPLPPRLLAGAPGGGAAIRTVGGRALARVSPRHCRR